MQGYAWDADGRRGEVVLDKISHCIRRENRISVGQKLKLLQGTRRNCGKRSTISRRYRYAFP